MTTYNDVKIQVDRLTPDEKMRLLEYLATLTRQQVLAQNTGSPPISSDPLVGLFSSTPDLATKSEEILQQEITEESGWTWK